MLSNLKCQPGSIAPAYVNACAAITHALNTVNPIIEDTGDTSLQHINSTLTVSKARIKDLLYNKFMPGFSDSRVMNLAQTADYLANK
jgi:hypothetical protein